MLDPSEYTEISVATVRALATQDCADFEVYLTRSDTDQAVLYRKAGTELSDPDFERMSEAGVTSVLVRTEDFHACEKILESKLGDILTNPEIAPVDKARIVHSAGVTAAREIMQQPVSADGRQRALHVLDHMIDCVLTDPAVSGFLLEMARHERTVASHMFVVSALAVILGHEVYGPDMPLLKQLGVAGMLHDAGKLAIPPEILNKPTPLTREEIVLIQQHPIESVRLIGDDPNVTPLARQMILQHHERVDGAGYPVGVKGDNLPKESRLLTIVDSFHAMIGRRSYREAMTTAAANRSMGTQAGRQFDPELLDHWTALCERHELENQEDTTPTAESPCDEELSSKHEHRPVSAPPKSVSQRPPRFDCKGTTMVNCVYAGRLSNVNRAPGQFSALVQDVSRGGLSIYTAHPMYRGEVLNIQMNTDNETVWLRSTVAWCRQKDENVYQSGLRFQKRISKDQSLERDLVTPLDQLDTPGATSKQSKKRTDSIDLSPDAPPQERRSRALKILAAMAATRDCSIDAQKTAVTLAMSGDVTVRLKAIDVLMNFNTRMARDALVALLKDPNVQVRERAVMSCGTLRITEALQRLRDCMQDSDECVALRAAGALGVLGVRSGLRLVGDALKSEGSNVRLAAVVLGQITGHHFGGSREGVKSARRYFDAKKLAGAAQSD